MSTKKKPETETPEEVKVAEEVVTPEAEETVEEAATPVKEENKSLNLKAVTGDDDNYDNGKVVGIVTNCQSLNVRHEPNTDSEVAAILQAGDEVIIIKEDSTDEFYKVNTTAGVEGYSMCSYISLK